MLSPDCIDSSYDQEQVRVGLGLAQRYVPMVVAGRYHLLERIARGSMGSVYRARDDRLGRELAIKVVSSRSVTIEGRQARLIDEAKALARVRHENVLVVYDVGSTDAREAYIAMDYVAGSTLRRWQQGRPLAALLEVYVEAGRGLAAAHRGGVVHRDFKPDNVLVSEADEVRRVVVGDFGLASASTVEPEGADADPHAAQEWATCTLRVLLEQEACSLGDRVEAGLEDLRTGGFPLALGAEDLGDLSPRCQREIGPRALENLAARHVLVTYFGGPRDRVDAIVGDAHPWFVEGVSFRGKSGHAQILVLPQGTPVGVVVEQDNLDAAWVKTLSPHEDLALRPRAHGCLALDLAVDSEWRGWATFVDGREVQLRMSEGEGTSLRAGAMVRVAQGQGEGPHTNEVIVADADGWSRTMTFEQSQIEGRCVPATADLGGRTRERYGLAQVTVEGCGGLVAAQASRAVGDYFAAHDLELRQLESLAAVVRAIAEIESTLGGGRPVGSPNVDLDVHGIMSDFATETLRQGVTVLLTLEIRCAVGDPDFVIVGHAIDLRGFNERARSHITGIDLSGLLEVRSVSVPDRAGLHDGFDLVLGGLLECTAVQLVHPPSTVDYYERVQLDYRVVHGGRCDAAEAELGLAYVENEPAVGTLCNKLDERAKLLDHRPSEDSTWVESIVRGGSDSELLLARTLAGSSDLYETTTLPLMRPGRYLVWVRTRDSRSISMRCFRAVSSQLAIYAQSGGGFVTLSNEYSVRVEAGLAYPFGPTKLGRVGPNLGYSLRGSQAESKHGLVLGAFVGFDVPISRCVHGVNTSRTSLAQQAERCANVARGSWSVAGNFGAGADLGFARGNSDLDLSIQVMVKVQLNVRVSCFVFNRVSLLFGGKSSAEGERFGDARAVLFGAGLVWAIRKR